MYHESVTFSIVPTNGKKIDVDFNSGKTTADAGAILLQQVDQKILAVSPLLVHQLARRHLTRRESKNCPSKCEKIRNFLRKANTRFASFLYPCLCHACLAKWY